MTSVADVSPNAGYVGGTPDKWFAVTSGLFVCAILPVLGMASLLHHADLWRDSPTMSAGLMAALVFPPLAAAAFARRQGRDGLIRGFAERGDSEQEQITIRVFVTAIIFAYTTALFLANPGAGTPAALLFMGLGMASAWGFLISLMAHPGELRFRKPAAIVIDSAALSGFIHFGGELATFWYPVYLWVILGNGFRYGLRAMFGSALVSAVFFAGVILATPSWRNHPAISVGLLLALVILPGYVSKLIRDLREAKAQAEKANAAKGRFLATMSHELRTPLSAMIGMGSVLRKTSLVPDQRDMLAIMEDSARTLLALINGVLDFSRMEAGKLQPETETFDLHQHVAATVHMLRPQAAEKGLSLTQRIDPRLPCHVRGWPQQFRQIVTNLVANAVKFTHEGKVTVRLELARADGADDRLRVVVADDGIGMSPETLDRIFQPFTQADGTVTRRYGGTGLGLAIVRQLVEMMGGAVHAESTVGKGSVFTIELPLDADATAEETIDLAGIRVVTLTDDPMLAEDLGRPLKAWGADPRSQASGDAKGHGRDIVIVDARSNPTEILDQPDVAGIPVGRRSLVAIVRNEAQAEQVLRETSALAAAAIVAPVEPMQLLRAIRSVLPMHGVPEHDDATQEEVSAPQRKLKVLLAEDNPVNRKVIGRILAIAGHDAHMVDDGEAALAALDEQEFDVALMDINMPGMSGYDVTKFHRMARLGERHLPILALTADVTAETRRLCKEAGMDAVLTKPIDATQLIQAIQDAVEDGAEDVLESGHEDMPEGVTSIAAHPGFTKRRAPVVKQETLAALEALGGGSSFLTEVVETFRTDARDVIEKMTEAALSADVNAFRDHAHSLRSSAANIGAARLTESLLAVRGITARELRRDAAAHIGELRENFALLETALERTVRELA